MVFQRLFGIAVLVALRAGVTTAAPDIQTALNAPVPASQEVGAESACANARSLTDKAAFEVAQLRAITAHLRKSRGMISGQEVLVRDDVSTAMLKTAVTAGRVVQRTSRTTAAGQLQLCVEMVFGQTPPP